MLLLYLLYHSLMNPYSFTRPHTESASEPNRHFRELKSFWVMENGPLTLGLEDGTIDVERLLVEPQDGHVSVDSVICFNDKIPKNVMDMEEVSCSFGGSNAGIAQEGKEVLSGEELDAIPVQVGYFQLQNEFCSMGEEYLLGVEFAESITNLDYGSIESLQASVSDYPNLASSADTDTPWKADQIRNMEAPKCQNDQLNNHSSECDIPSHHECESLIDTKALKSPTSCTLQNIGNFYDISSCSFQDTLSNRIDESFSPSCEMYNSLKIEKNEEFGLMGQDVNANRFQREDSSAIISAHTSCTDTLPAQKRSRKPTQRYIDELADPISKYSKKRREVSSSTSKLKCLEVQDYKKCNIGSRAMRLPAEETSVIAIQVPFGSLVQNECPKSHACDAVRCLDGGNLTTKSKDNRLTLHNQKKMDDGVPAVHLRKKEDCVTAASQKRRNGFVSEGHLKKRVDSVAAASQKKRDSCIIGASPEKRDYHVTATSQRTRDDSLIAARRKKKDDCLAPEIPEEAIGRRKHHRLWTLSEVQKLIDGVSQFGVGSWSRIKKLFFSTSAYRTSVDLKDKWRNLLKASGIQEQGGRQGEKKRNMAWRPLPKSILRRVCELATMYPYPKGRKPKMLHIHRDSSEKGTDITLSNYRRILRSINGN